MKCLFFGAMVRRAQGVEQEVIMEMRMLDSDGDGVRRILMDLSAWMDMDMV
jgi:hypothetical protein